MEEDVTRPARLWSLQEVAERFQLSERTVHNLLNSGELEGMLIARRWKFTEDALAKFQKSKTPETGKGAKKKRAYHRKSA